MSLFILNNLLSWSENLVPALTWKSNNRWQITVEKRRQNILEVFQRVGLRDKENPDETAHNKSFHQNLHCLPLSFWYPTETWFDMAVLGMTATLPHHPTQTRTMKTVVGQLVMNLARKQREGRKRNDRGKKRELRQRRKRNLNRLKQW